MPGVATGELTAGCDDCVERRAEARLDGAREDPLVHTRQGLRRWHSQRRERREHALNDSGQEGRGRALARHVAHGEAEARIGELDVVEEVAANRPAGHRLRNGLEEGALALRIRQKGLLDLGSDLQLLLHLGLLERLPVQPRVLDGHRGLGCQHLERGLRGRRGQRALLLAVEVQHADALFLHRSVRLIDKPDNLEWRTEDLPNAEHDRVGVVAHSPFEQVGHHPRLARGEDLLGDLPARRKAGPGKRHAALAPRDLELQHAIGVGEHDEPPLRACDFEGRVDDERQDLGKDAARTEGAQAFQKCRHLV